MKPKLVTCCVECGSDSLTQYFDNKNYLHRSICTRCGKYDTMGIRDVEFRRSVEIIYLERKTYEREVDNYIYGTKTVLE